MWIDRLDITLKWSRTNKLLAKFMFVKLREQYITSRLCKINFIVCVNTLSDLRFIEPILGSCKKIIIFCNQFWWSWTSFYSVHFSEISKQIVVTYLTWCHCLKVVMRPNKEFVYQNPSWEANKLLRRSRHFPFLMDVGGLLPCSQ